MLIPQELQLSLQKNVNYKAIGISMDWQNEPL